MTLLMSLLFVIEILAVEVCSVEIDVFVVGLFICSETFFALYIFTSRAPTTTHSAPTAGSPVRTRCT
jgi:hypothetical protein